MRLSDNLFKFVFYYLPTLFIVLVFAFVVGYLVFAIVQAAAITREVIDNPPSNQETLRDDAMTNPVQSRAPPRRLLLLLLRPAAAGHQAFLRLEAMTVIAARDFARDASQFFRDGEPVHVVPPRPEYDTNRAIVEIFLTFDDGPHAVPIASGDNYTYNVLRTLEHNSVQDSIKAVFFVQTHVPNRGEHRVGQDLLRLEADKGHIVGIHTGSTRDHVDHRHRALRPAYDVTGDGVRDGVSALESDLIRAKERIRACAGIEPTFVRPTYGAFNSEVRETYRRQGLWMILWDIETQDSYEYSRRREAVVPHIHREVSAAVQRGERTLLVLFHDINATTQARLDDYLIAIFEAVEHAGATPHFVTSTRRLRELLDAHAQ